MSTPAHDVIHKALIEALTKHGESKYGVMASFDPIATETKIDGFYKLRFVSEDITKAVQAYIALVSLPPASGVSS
jgi:hypothetical protein